MRHEKIQERATGNVSELLDDQSDPYPKVVEIHPTDKCNHRCDYCFHGGTGYDPERESEVLSIERYRELFEELSRLGIDDLSVAGGGEPLMDPRVTSIYRAANETGQRIRTVSNGNFLHDDVLESVLDTAELRVSVDAATPETYGKLRNVAGDLYDQTIDNLTRIIEERDRQRAELEIGTTFLINDINKDEAVTFAEEMLERGVDEIIYKHDIYNLVTTDESELARLQRSLKSIDSDKIEVRSKLSMDVPGTQCFVPYFKTAITPYGEVYSCCLGTQPGENNGYGLGNLWNKSFEEIWKSSSELRKNMRTEGVDCESCNHTDYKINKEMEKMQ